MKDSGVEWLGEVPQHWNFDKLRYIFNFSKGLTITKADLMETGIPCVNYGEIHSKYGFEVSAERHALKCVDSSYLESDKSSLMSNGDFVFADTSEDLEGAGNFTHVSGDTNIFAGYHTIIARQTKNNNARFLAYLIDSKVFRTQIRLAVKGVKVFSITQAILRDSSVWLPNITEQTAIVNFLDDKTAKIDTLIAKARQAIELMKERRKALISAAVTGKIDVRGIV
jgi:type I restriction enzyme S subunit